jgi:hypothetical protein
MRIESGIVEAVWARFAREGRPVHRMNFPDGEANAVDLGAGPGGGHVLRRDGTVFEWDLIERPDGALVLATERSAVRGLVSAARRFEELKAALPIRDLGAQTCSTCRGLGFVDFGDHQKFLVCSICDGLGWTAA